MTTEGGRVQDIAHSRKESSLKNATLLSQICFSWAYPLLKLGAKRPLQEIDLDELDTLDTSAYNKSKIEEMWQQEIISKRKNLARALFSDYLKTTWLAQVLMCINMGARIVQAWALGLLMEQFGRFDVGDSSEGNGSVDAKNAYFYSGIIILSGLVAFPSKQSQFFETYRKGMQLRVGLVASIYAKTLRLPAVGIEAKKNVTAGNITNLASNDVERFIQASVAATFLILGPLIAIIILVVGMHIIGPVFAAGYGLLVFLIPLQMFVGRRFAHYRSKVAAFTDERVSLVSQAISGVRVMKYNGWEEDFAARITEIRVKEVAALQRASRYKALNESIFYVGGLSVSVFIFAIHEVLGGELTPKNVFTTMTLLNIVQFILTKHVPNAVMGLSECYVSCARIQAFFELPEQKMDALENGPSTSACMATHQDIALHDSKEVLSLSDVTCHWKGWMDPYAGDEKQCTEEDLPVALSGISLSCRTNQLYCVIGKVGSGKSAFLQALAGELAVSKGTIRRSYKTLSYCAQSPWIMNGSVRQNILMGNAFSERWYLEVIKACRLLPDIARFQNGDETIVGDRGVQLSGGQKARIGLARVLFCDADVLLLDDPLSAVDSKVARSLFYDAIEGLAVVRGKCVILVTHQHQFVGHANRCILLDNGKVLSEGSFADISSCSKNDLTYVLQTAKDDDNNEEEIDTDVNVSEFAHMPKFEELVKNDETQAERRITGTIRLDTWRSYAKAVGGIGACLFFFLVFSLTQVCQLVIIVLLGRWSSAGGYSYLTPVLCFTLGMIFLSMVRAYLSFHLLIRASQRLHTSMLRSVLRAQISFFDTNPQGRILNRFSADVGICDETLPLTVYDFAVGFFVVLGSVATAVTVLPFILLTLPLLLWMFWYLRRIFVATSRELKRLEGMGRSPIFVMLSESLEGISTIRTNGKIEYFSKSFETLHDGHTRAYFAFTFSSRWFAFQMDLLAFVLMSCASILAVLFQDQGWFDVDPAILGLSLTLLIQISTTNFPWVVRQSAEVTNQMVSVERITEFGNLSQEPPLKTQVDEENEHWPMDGSIIVKNLRARYRLNLPYCLDDVTFSIASGTRTGIVGRTGSGKSSLVQALFRILEADEGSIEIGGVNINSIGLHKLRTSMAVISQMPVLFGSRTLKENLDPFNEFDLASIRIALSSVQMIDTIDKLPCGLDSPVVEGGSNFSVGQRQLLCLARAILQKSKILVLDEPTANIDSGTDMLLQQTLIEQFSEATIITVAHRLDTIIDYDHIIVLNDGKVLECGTPRELLSVNGHFASMIANTGELAETLRKRTFLRTD